MNHRIPFKQKALLCVFCFMFTQTTMGTEPFIMFQSSNDTWLLDTITIGYVDTEHSCVQLAVANLTRDFEQVTGVHAEVSPSPRIIIGTVGVNPKIDLWVIFLNCFNLNSIMFTFYSSETICNQQIKLLI